MYGFAQADGEKSFCRTAEMNVLGTSFILLLNNLLACHHHRRMDKDLRLRALTTGRGTEFCISVNNMEDSHKSKFGVVSYKHLTIKLNIRHLLCFSYK